MGISRPQNVKVTFRKMKFGFEKKGFSAHWHNGSPFISHWWNALSQAFPPGERFFIDSVRAMRDRIDDEELLEEIESFLRQEAHHTIQHRNFNREIAELGYDVERLEARYAHALDRARKNAGPLGMLAITTALEHFTAGFAQQYFQNPQVAEGADPNVEALWAWHAAEETEHKATAYDVYDRVHGGYWTRVTILPTAWAAIIAITVLNVFDLLYQDGKLGDVRDIVRGLRYVFGRRGIVTGMLPAFVKYLKPQFHPWDEDDSAALEQWERDNEHYIEQRGAAKQRVNRVSDVAPRPSAIPAALASQT
jgi:predicted metal-dependent hydrolase